MLKKFKILLITAFVMTAVGCIDTVSADCRSDCATAYNQCVGQNKTAFATRICGEAKNNCMGKCR